MMRERLRITISGAVQGIGFRPYVYRLATELALTGFVRNRGAMVEIEAEGDCPGRLLEALGCAPPPGAAVEDITFVPLVAGRDARFRIAPSVVRDPADALPRVLADLACCADCLRDVLDPLSRFYRYPFTNCSRCGPRYSIQLAVPYDRARTTMARFAMCPACRAEYEDPASRRFHAQPIACPVCGPSLALTRADGAVAARGDSALDAAVALIAAGGILALKGVGGYQLIADAHSAAALARLRLRKARPAKPFALMVRDLDMARRCCSVNPAEAALLASPAAPIVLLERAGPVRLPDEVAPGLGTLGLMLPATPLHHLLMHALSGAVVCTSGNRAGEPIAIDAADARERLAGIADGWLDHDRPICRPLDDSVARVIDGGAQLLRAGRGYAPVVLPYRSGPVVLACGSDLKNSVALAAGGRITVSQHLGDLEDARCLDAMHDAVVDLCSFHAVEPEFCAVDAHPDSISAVAGPAAQLPRRAVPHHLAHALAVMLEHDLAGPLLAVVWDGNGFGPDGTLWGGEFLRIERPAGVRGDGVRWDRVAHLRPYPLPGGDAAAREPERSLAGLLWQIPALRGRIPAAQRALLERGLNTPLTTSAGRLFDGIAALTGFHGRQSYEGEAASRLEHVAQGPAAVPYPLPADGGVLDWVPLVIAACGDAERGVAAGVIGARFHAALAAAIVEQARIQGLQTVILTGGCFQNRLLTESTAAGLRRAGFTPVLARRLPPNDGAIAAGQAVAACEGVVG